MRPSFRSLITVFFLLLTMTTTQIACSQEENRVVFHTVKFDAGDDSPNIQILEFQYGQSKGPGMHEVAKSERGLPAIASTGETLMPEEVYFKWRDKTTDKVHEDRVDMRSRLPQPSVLKGQMVYFLVDQYENQLYIYLIPQKLGTDGGANRRKAGEVPNGPGTTSYLQVKTIYPDNSPPRPRGYYPKLDLEIDGITDTARVIIKGTP